MAVCKVGFETWGSVGETLVARSKRRSRGLDVSKLRNPTPRLLMFLDFEGFKTNRCEECRCCMRMVCEIVAFLGHFWGSVEYIDACELECGGYVTSHKRS
jgi:hypothetical protein